MGKKNRFGLNLSFLSNLSIAAKIGIMVGVISVALVIVYFVAIAPKSKSSPGTPSGPPPVKPPPDAPPKPPPDAPPKPPPGTRFESFIGGFQKNDRTVYTTQNIKTSNIVWTLKREKKDEFAYIIKLKNNKFVGIGNATTNYMMYIGTNDLSLPMDQWSPLNLTITNVSNIIQLNDFSFVITIMFTNKMYYTTDLTLPFDKWTNIQPTITTAYNLFQLNDGTFGIGTMGGIYTLPLAKLLIPTPLSNWNGPYNPNKLWDSILPLPNGSIIVISNDDDGNVIYITDDVLTPYTSWDNYTNDKKIIQIFNL